MNLILKSMSSHYAKPEQRRLRCSQWQTPSYWTHHASPAGAREEAMADFIARWLDRSPDNG
jgi:hypothetical protein